MATISAGLASDSPSLEVERYHHDAIDLYNTDTIRVFKIEGLRNDGSFALEITQAPLKMLHVVYTALSYTWGNGEATETVYIKDYPLPIRENLSKFLQHAVKSLRGTYFWIDAICIDQSNVEERNHQVRLMSDIYEKAERVLVWLGSGEGLINHAFERLTARNNPKLENPTEDDHWMLTTSLALACQVDYWSRMWVVQEMLLATKVCIMFNGHIIDWSNFWSAAKLIVELHETDLESSATWNVAGASFAVRHYLSRQALAPGTEGWRYASLIEVLLQYSSSKCKDLRDRVYALLSLVEGSKDFVVDYGETAATLALRTCTFFNGNLAALLTLQKCLGLTNRALEKDLIVHGLYHPSFQGHVKESKWHKKHLMIFEAHQYSVTEALRPNLHQRHVLYSQVGKCPACRKHFRNRSLVPGGFRSIICIPGLGLRQHIFLDNTRNGDYNIHLEEKGAPENFLVPPCILFESIMGIHRETNGCQYVSLSVDLYVFLIRYLRLKKVRVGEEDSDHECESGSDDDHDKGDVDDDELQRPLKLTVQDIRAHREAEAKAKDHSRLNTRSRCSFQEKLKIHHERGELRRLRLYGWNKVQSYEREIRFQV